MSETTSSMGDAEHATVQYDRSGLAQVAAAQAHDRELRPVAETERIHALDVLRGAALFGILMVNMAFFTLPLMHVLNNSSLGDAPLAEKIAWSIVSTFFHYKFVSLFSLLFGIGFAVQFIRARARQASRGAFMGRYAVRLIVLLVFGLAHGLLLWYGDILTLYALLGVTMLVFGFLSPRTLFGCAAGALLIAIVLGVGCGALQFGTVAQAGESYEVQMARAAEVAASDDAPRGWEAMRRGKFDPNNPIWINAETLAFQQGPFMDALIFRAVIFGFALVSAAFSFGWHVLAMFLIGAALMKLDFFAAHRQEWHRKLVIIALPLGLALEALNTFVYWHNEFRQNLATILMHPVHEVGSVLLCFGYVGVICQVISGGWLRPLTGAIACVGRMSLTNYFMQTVIACALMYWWGLGWFGTVSHVEMIGIAIAIYLGQIVFSMLWLSAFRTGPMEWLWRSITYLRPQPLLRREPIANTA